MKNKIFLAVMVIVLTITLLAACGKKGGGQDNGGGGSTATTVEELSAENGVSASGTFESGTAIKAESHAADSKQGKAAISAIDKPYDSAKIAIFDISVSKNGEKVQPNG